jgi:hypothetical protein
VGTPTFYHASIAGPLRQGEIICNLGELIPEPGSALSEGGPKVRLQIHPYAIVLSQDCDLEQDFRVRQQTDPVKIKTDKLLPTVLFCQAIAAESMMATVSDGQIWKRIKQNKDERYQYLRELLPETDALSIGLPALGLDFKKYFTLATPDVYAQINLTAKRRAFLAARYMEHLSTRFFYFQSRVALDEDHVTGK